ncbi:MAG: DNA primase [Planctomycetaceae bacterium]
MPAVIADDFKELVRTRTDIVSLIAESVTLQPQRGGREFTGLCPFHDDHNPSLRVYPDRQSYRCWVCNEGGDCFSFVMKRERVGFREALEMLANRARIELPRKYRAATGPSGENKNRQYEVLAWAEQQFHECLLQAPEGERARKYLRERGVSGESIVKFKLGYHPAGWEWLLERARNRFTSEQLVTVRLAGEREGGRGCFDYFVDRVMFPIRDAQGRAVAFGGRVLPDSPPTSMGKYWNSPDGPLFNKSRLLYGLDQAREAIVGTNTAVVVEGYMACIMAHQHGMTNCIATLGTALNDTHVMGLKRFARRVVLVYDGDDPGRAASERALPRFLAHEIDLRLVTLPAGLDPADFVLAHGGDALKNLLDNAPEAWDQKFRLLVERHGLDSIDARHRVLDEMLEVLAQVRPPAGVGLAGKWQERESIVIGQLSHRLKTPESLVRTRLAEVRTRLQERHGAAAGSVATLADVADLPQAEPAEPLNCDQLSSDERAGWWLLMAIFSAPEQSALFREEISADQVTHADLRKLYEICLEIWEQGGVPSYDRVTTRLEEPGLKALAARIDHESRVVPLTPEVQTQTLRSFRRGPRKGPYRGPHAAQSFGAEQLDAKGRLLRDAERIRQGKSSTTP